ncbi:MAG: hypothetical protein AUK48_05120 [Oscillatoriales cyanobacterium CG2_30_44_21]|nr:MAG: hypothetical protein AUK48_05120 [Oscillatoriales cyanobacterium CG2_30_44_21]
MILELWLTWSAISDGAAQPRHQKFGFLIWYLKMKLSTSLVAVKKIIDPTSHSSFDPEQVERLAQLILQLEGLINPLIVRRASFQSYEVVEGHFEYQAAARAREIDPRKGEMISAYIIEPEDTIIGAAIAEQVKLMQNSRPSNVDNLAAIAPTQVKQTVPSLDILPFILEKLQSTEKLLLSQLASQASQIQNLEKSIHEFANTLTKFSPASINASLPLVSAKSSKPAAAKKPKGIVDPVVDDFNNLDLDHLYLQLAKLGFEGNKGHELAKAITDNRQLGLFTSISDVLKRVKFTGFSKLKVKEIQGLW